VYFPKSVIQEDRVDGIIKTLATENKPMHKRKLTWSVIAMPFTAPIGLIPVLPNIPFFYLVFRAYSHWRALSGSNHLEFLLENRLMKRCPSKILDDIYSVGLKKQIIPISDSVNESNIRSKEPAADEEVLLLQESDGQLMAQSFDYPPLQAEVERAVRQVKHALKASAELKEEKQHLEAAAQKGQEQEDKK